jgi:hypothetical protein
MTCQDNEILLNNTLIQMSCSFLQYVSESWPWVRLEASSIEKQVRVLAARQRQDVGEIVSLLSVSGAQRIDWTPETQPETHLRSDFLLHHLASNCW